MTTPKKTPAKQRTTEKKPALSTNLRERVLDDAKTLLYFDDIPGLNHNPVPGVSGGTPD